MFGWSSDWWKPSKKEVSSRKTSCQRDQHPSECILSQHLWVKTKNSRVICHSSQHQSIRNRALNKMETRSKEMPFFKNIWADRIFCYKRVRLWWFGSDLRIPRRIFKNFGNELWTLSWWSFGTANTFKCLESLVDKTNNAQCNTSLNI